MANACRTSQLNGHPCFGGNHKENGRIHLPVAPRCNIKCRYCTRRHDCVNESRPGVTSRLLSPEEALLRVREVMAHPGLGPKIKVVGIAGPGDPLANQATFDTFRLVGAEYPHLIKCLSTNGLLLPEKLDELVELGVGSLTVTLNALDAAVGSRIYAHVFHQGQRYLGEEAAALLIANQLAGIREAARHGLTVKVNTVLIPGVNEDQLPLIADRVKELGAFVMNILPLIPQAEFAHLAAPSPELLEAARRIGEQRIGQFRHCQQCRADAIGLIGEESLPPALN